MSQISQDDFDGMAWWNGLTTVERSDWMKISGSAAPVDAWFAFKAYMADQVQLQARRTDSDDGWFAVNPSLVSVIEASRFLNSRANNMIYQYRVVPASKKLPGVVPFN